MFMFLSWQVAAEKLRLILRDDEIELPEALILRARDLYVLIVLETQYDRTVHEMCEVHSIDIGIVCACSCLIIH